MTCFLHVSDTHLCFDTPCPKNCCSPQQLEAAYAYAAKLDCPPKFVLLTGDFVHEGGLRDYSEARSLITRLDETYHTRTLVALGNHDRHKPFFEGYLGEPDRTGRYFYCCEIGGMRVVMLDSAVDDQIPGELDDAQLTWLEKTLVQPCSLPTVVALHHPPCGTAVRETNGNNLMRPEAFLEILERHPVTAVLAGHKHTASATSHKGIPVCTGAGVAFAIQMPQGGRLRFVKEMTVQYCALYDDRFYWSPIRPEGGEVIFEMTPKEMRDYHAKK